MKNRFETFTVLVAKINRNIRKIKNREMTHYGLKSSHVSCLYYLYMEEGLTATELCESCEEDKATISRSLDYLEKNGFIKCKSEGSKRYRSPYVLTEKGEEIGKKISCKIDAVFEQISVRMTEKERCEIYKSLKIIAEGLDEILQSVSI